MTYTYKVIHLIDTKVVQLVCRAKDDEAAKCIGDMLNALSVQRRVSTERVGTKLVTKYKLLAGDPLC